MKFEWMKNQTSLIIEDSSVDSLEDLVFFPNLTHLTLGNSSNKNIPPITSMSGIENCTKLKSLTIYYGPNKDYSAISKLSNLTNFYKMSGTDYEEILNELKLCKKLNNLALINMNISDISKLNDLNNLFIYLYRTIITKIEGLQNMLKLKNLQLANNKITKIEDLII